ncbi:MAG: threonine--tRNA ligase [Acholeplasmatales bacterium]|nr:threonine--tRNA ligase [Acholeplasmatales bacterium]
MIKLTLKDGSVKEVEEGLSYIEIAKGLSSSLAKQVVVAKVDGQLVDLGDICQKDCNLEFIVKGDKEAFDVLNHSTAHLLANAVKELYPDAQFGVGPEIEEGFYYDIAFTSPIQPADLAKIEKKMVQLSKANIKITHKDMSKEEAHKIFAADKYKTELIDAVEGDTVHFYTQGDYHEVCRGPHVMSTGVIQHFKLLSIAGAYWRGDSKNEQLTRIYGTSWFSKEDLEKELALIEDRKERDHRKIGKDMGIFMFDELVGRGLPMYLPNGFTVRRLLADYIMNKELALGYKHVMTPSLGNVNLYKTSGHWAHYKDDMFPAMEMDDEAYVLRPMNCPHHMVMFRSKLHSYRDLPVRIAEIANDFRFEASGALTGLERARSFTQNDSHIFCRPDQIGSEFKNVLKLILDVYNDFGFENYRFRLSLRDVNNKEKYFGNDDLWEKSEAELRTVLTELNADFYEAPGEAAFYGPKLDVQVKSAIGHDVTLSTIQLDYQLPERFELEYVDENGGKSRPVVIHRAILGSLDRFIAFLLEETKGVLPLWLAPVQTKIIPVNLNLHTEYCNSLVNKLIRAGIRFETDYRDEKMGKKIREAQMAKIPYQLVIGDAEVANNQVTYREYGKQEQTTVTVEEFISMVQSKVSEHK